MEGLDQLLVVIVEVTEPKDQHSRHVYQLHMISLELLPALALEYICLDLFEQLGSSDEDTCTTVHPNRQHIESQVDGVLMVVDCDLIDARSLEE